MLICIFMLYSSNLVYGRIKIVDCNRKSLTKKLRESLPVKDQGCGWGMWDCSNF